jgi:hypothetical protein
MLKKVLFILITIVVLIILILHSPLVAAFEFLADFDTEYSKGFSYEKQSQVKIGMNKEEVEKLLGQPFDQSSFPYPNAASGTNEECYWYSQAKSYSERVQRFGDINWHRVSVCFLENKVLSSSRTTFFN